jgi:hypothetical protein
VPNFLVFFLLFACAATERRRRRRRRPEVRLARKGTEMIVFLVLTSFLSTMRGLGGRGEGKGKGSEIKEWDDAEGFGACVGVLVRENANIVCFCRSWTACGQMRYATAAKESKAMQCTTNSSPVRPASVQRSSVKATKTNKPQSQRASASPQAFSASTPLPPSHMAHDASQETLSNRSLPFLSFCPARRQAPCFQTSQKDKTLPSAVKPLDAGTDVSATRAKAGT